MDYQQAQKIRSKSFASIMTEKLAEGGSIGGSLRATVSERSQARMKGIKEKFDILNIAKMMTGGSNLAPAILGRMLGRSTRDIKYFAGIKDKKTASKLGPTGDGVSPEMMDILEKIYEFLKETNDEDRLKKQEESQFAKEKELERMRRHKELMEAITGKPYTNTYTKVKKEEDGTSLMDSIFGSGAFKLLGNLLKFAISPLGLTILGFVAAQQFIQWVADNMTDYSAITPKQAAEILERNDPNEMKKYGGVEGLKKIIENTPEIAQELMDRYNDPNLKPEEKLQIEKEARRYGGIELVKQIAKEGEIFYTPGAQQVEFAEKLGLGARPTKDMFPKDSPQRLKLRQDEWDKIAAGRYNNDGTLKEEFRIKKPETTPQEKTEVKPAITPVSNSEPPSVGNTNVGQQLNTLQGENLMAKIDDKTEVAKAITTNNVVKNDLNSSVKRGYIPAVRNQEETFQQMILQSTRVV